MSDTHKAELLEKRAKVAKELADWEKQIFDYESTYRRSTTNVGNVVHGYRMPLEDTEPDTHIDRIFSKSSTTYQDVKKGGLSIGDISKVYGFEKMQSLGAFGAQGSTGFGEIEPKSTEIKPLEVPEATVDLGKYESESEDDEPLETPDVEDQTAGFTDFETKLEDLGGFDENCNKV
jgi:hypothetical protein